MVSLLQKGGTREVLSPSRKQQAHSDLAERFSTSPTNFCGASEPAARTATSRWTNIARCTLAS